MPAPSPAQNLTLPPGTESLAATIIPSRQQATKDSWGGVRSTALFTACAAGIPLLFQTVRLEFARIIGLSGNTAGRYEPQGMLNVHNTHNTVLNEAMAARNPLSELRALTSIRQDIRAARRAMPDQLISLKQQFSELPPFRRVTAVTLGTVLTGLAVYHACSAVKHFRQAKAHREEATHTEELVKDRVRFALGAERAPTR